MARFTVPRLTGRGLGLAATLARSWAGRSLIGALVRREMHVDQLGAFPDTWRARLALDARVLSGRPPRAWPHAELGAPPPSPWPRSSADFARAYGAEMTTPERVLEAMCRAAAELASRTPSLDPTMRIDLRRATEDARASTSRWAAGCALGPLDGVPILVKEQIAVEGLPSLLGTAGLPETGVREDATIVSRLRAAGAVIVGHTPMTEFGLSPIGVNPRRRMPRNALADDRAPGGSSTGSAVATALGLSPVSVAADGGGSIRIPAALNGVFGLKPTYGLVSRHGDAFEGTFNHFGPIGATTTDLAAFMDVVAGPDPRDARTRDAPRHAPGAFTAALGRGVRRLRIGVLDGELADAEPGIARACDRALSALGREGATLVRVPFPMGPHVLTFAMVLIAAEGFADGAPIQRAHGGRGSNEVALTLAIVGGFTAADLAEAWTLREGLRREVARLLEDVDVLALPTTRIVAPRVSDAEFESGLLCSTLLKDLCRYTVLGNMTGLPALTCPLEGGEDGMPAGLQLIGDAFDEGTVLAAGAHLERVGVSRAARPTRPIDLLA